MIRIGMSALVGIGLAFSLGAYPVHAEDASYCVGVNTVQERMAPREIVTCVVVGNGCSYPITVGVRYVNAGIFLSDSANPGKRVKFCPTQPSHIYQYIGTCRQGDGACIRRMRRN